MAEQKELANQKEEAGQKKPMTVQEAVAIVAEHARRNTGKNHPLREAARVLMEERRYEGSLSGKV